MHSVESHGLKNTSTNTGLISSISPISSKVLEDMSVDLCVIRDLPLA